MKLKIKFKNLTGFWNGVSHSVFRHKPIYTARTLALKGESRFLPVSWDRDTLYCCCCLITKLCLTLCNPMDCSMPGFPVPSCLPEFSQTHIHWLNDAIQPSHPLLPHSPPALNPSQHRSFPDESVLRIRWPKYWASALVLNSEYSELISFRFHWFDLFAV